MMLASPERFVVALGAEREAVPFVSLKLIVRFDLGMPRSKASTVRGIEMVAPCAIHLIGVTAARSSADDVATTVVCSDCGGE